MENCEMQVTVAKLETYFIAAGCAIRPNVVGWCSKTGFIVFAASTDICLAKTIANDSANESGNKVGFYLNQVVNDYIH